MNLPEEMQAPLGANEVADMTLNRILDFFRARVNPSTAMVWHEHSDWAQLDPNLGAAVVPPGSLCKAEELLPRSCDIVLASS